MWMQEGRKWHFGWNWVLYRYQKYGLKDTFWAVEQVSTQSLYIFMEEIRFPKTIKYKGNLSTNLPFLQNDENALTTLLHSPDDILLVIFKRLLNWLKCLIYHIIKDKKVFLRRVWIRLTTAHLLCAREFRQNNALALQFWCLSNALTLRVRALDASKSQRACIILSKFTRKSKYAVINL